MAVPVVVPVVVPVAVPLELELDEAVLDLVLAAVVATDADAVVEPTSVFGLDPVVVIADGATTSARLPLFSGEE